MIFPAGQINAISRLSDDYKTTCQFALGHRRVLVTTNTAMVTIHFNHNSRASRSCSVFLIYSWLMNVVLDVTLASAAQPSEPRLSAERLILQVSGYCDCLFRMYFLQCWFFSWNNKIKNCIGWPRVFGVLLRDRICPHFKTGWMQRKVLNYWFTVSSGRRLVVKATLCTNKNSVFNLKCKEEAI